MHARPERLRRVDLQVVGRSDQYSGHSKITSGAAVVWKSSGKDNLVDVHEISE